MNGRAFNQATIGLTLGAAPVPTAAVLHIVGLAAAPVHQVAKAEVVRLAQPCHDFGRVGDEASARPCKTVAHRG